MLVARRLTGSSIGTAKPPSCPQKYLPRKLALYSKRTDGMLLLLEISRSRNCSSARMPKMRAIPQFVSAPLNPVPLVEHFSGSSG